MYRFCFSTQQVHLPIYTTQSHAVSIGALDECARRIRERAARTSKRASRGQAHRARELAIRRKPCSAVAVVSGSSSAIFPLVGPAGRREGGAVPGIGTARRTVLSRR